MSQSRYSLLAETPAALFNPTPPIEELYQMDLWLLQAAFLSYEKTHGKEQSLKKQESFNFKPSATNYVLGQSWYMLFTNQPLAVIQIDSHRFRQTNYTLSQHIKMAGITKECQLLLTRQQMAQVNILLAETGLVPNKTSLPESTIHPSIQQKQVQS